MIAANLLGRAWNAAADERGEASLAFPAHDVAHFLLFSAYNLGVVAKVDNSRERLSRYAAIALSVVADGPGAGAAQGAEA